MARVVIEVISTGNELLDGTISDTNTQRLALALRPLGLTIARSSVIRDDPAAITEALKTAVKRSTHIIVSGGLGPTTDDLTLEVAAKTFRVPMVVSAAAKKNILSRVQKSGRQWNPGHDKMCLVPQGVKTLRNNEGSAPGIEWKRGRATLYFLAGVPREYDFVLKDSLLPRFSKLVGAKGPKKFLRVLKVFGWAESLLNEMIKTVTIPAGVEVGYRTHLPENHLKFLVTASSEAESQRILEKPLAAIREKLGTAIFSETDLSFEESFLQFCLHNKITVAMAESCTGGLVSSMITKISGSSAIFDRGLVTYTNKAKEELLGVQSSTLQKFGAVSEETAQEMVGGLLTRTAVERAAAITGIAGPTGGSAEKPVGTIWIAVCKRGASPVTKKLSLSFNRELNQRWSAYEALQMLKDL